METRKPTCAQNGAANRKPMNKETKELKIKYLETRKNT